MSNYKIYMGGFRGIQGVVIAESKEEAEARLYEKLGLGSLPCELEEVELPGYKIVERKIVPLEDKELKNRDLQFQMQMQANTKHKK